MKHHDWNQTCERHRMENVVVVAAVVIVVVAEIKNKE